MVGRSSLLMLVFQQPLNWAALTHPRATPKLSGSSTGVKSQWSVFTDGAAALAATSLQQRASPWVDDHIYQAKLQSQTRKAEASEEDTYALIVAGTLAMECLGPLALAIAIAVVGTFMLGDGEQSFFIASPTISQLVGGAWVASEATFYLCCIATAAFFSATPGHAPGVRGDETEWDAEGRAEVWRRIIKDPSIDVKELLEGWMYRTDVKQASSLDLLTAWTAARLGLPAASTEARPSRAAVAAAGVAYSELSVGA